LTGLETAGHCIQIVDRYIEIVDDRSTGVENWNNLDDRPTSARTPLRSHLTSSRFRSTIWVQVLMHWNRWRSF